VSEKKLHIDSSELVEKLAKDPLLHYPELVAFCKEYSHDKSIYAEVNLLGSYINESVENPEIGFIKTTEEISNKAVEIIDQVLASHEDMLVEEPRVEYASDHFLKLKPLDRVMYSCRNVSKRMSPTFQLNDVSLDLVLGQITALVGENGNGKTTLLRIIAGELEPDEGELEYPTFSPGTLRWAAIKKEIGYVRQQIKPLSGVNSVRQFLRLTAAVKGIVGKENDDMVSFIISRLGLEKHQGKLWSELSSGFKLRFELARQLLWSPRILILDEPLANLDIKAQMSFLMDLRSLTNSINNSMAVIVSTQNIYEIEKIADRVVFLRDGRPLYNGEVATVSLGERKRSYEIDTEADTILLLKAMEELDIIEIRTVFFYRIIYTGEMVYADQVLHALSHHGIIVKYFRDITNSTRLLFEK
jgi:ABC-2 type transport system ATP-binding protein